MYDTPKKRFKITSGCAASLSAYFSHCLCILSDSFHRYEHIVF